MDAILGVPRTINVFAGIDEIGECCRIDPSVSVMRFGHGDGKIVLADGVSVYAQVRLVIGDAAANSCVGMRIGARTIVNVGCYLSGEGGLEIGDDVLIGPHVKLLSAGHAIDDGEVAIAHNPLTRGRIVVEDGAWIGAGAIVLEGVRIGRGAVVAAGSVVSKAVPAGAVAAGVPARVLRLRRVSEFFLSDPRPGKSHGFNLRRIWGKFTQFR